MPKSKTTINRQNKLDLLLKLDRITTEIMVKAKKEELDLINGWELKDIIKKMEFYYRQIVIEDK